MIFRFKNHVQFTFRAPSVHEAQAFICYIYNSRYSMNPDDGRDWVGNYLSILSTDNQPGFSPICEVL